MSQRCYKTIPDIVFLSLILLALIALCPHKVGARIESVETPSDDNKSFSKCVLSIAQKHFKDNSITAIVTPELHTKDQLVSEVIMGTQRKILTKSAMEFGEKTKSSVEGKVHNYILFIDSKDESDVILKRIMKSSSWNPRANFLVIIGGMNLEWNELVTHILASFWGQFVINISVIVPMNGTSSYRKIVTWLPYEAQNCGRQPGRFVEVGSCQDSNVVPSDTNVFPDKSSVEGKVHNYILFIDSKDESDVILKRIMKSSSWNPRANFLVIIGGMNLEWNELVTHILASFWSQFVINISVIVPMNGTSSYRKIVTWLPYEAQNCGRQPGRFIEVGSCQDSNVVPSDTNVFPDKVSHDLNGCPFRFILTGLTPFVITNPVDAVTTNVNLTEGIEIKLFLTIAKKINMKPEFSTASWSTWRRILGIDYNGTDVDYLFRQFADIGATLLTPLPKFIEWFDISESYATNDYIIALKNSDPYPHWYGLIHIFQIPVWISSILFCVFMCLLLWILAKKTANESYQFYRLSNISFNLSKVMINVASAEPKTFRLRWFFMLWCIFCLNWSTAYTSSLISMITKPLNSNKVNTVKDILDFGMKMAASPVMYDYFRSDFRNDRTTERIRKHLELCPPNNFCNDLAARNGSSGYQNKLYRKYPREDHTDVVKCPL